MKVKLKNIGKIITGNTPSKQNAHYYTSNGIAFVKPDMIKQGQICKLTDSNEHLSEEARTISRIVPLKSLLITCIGIIGKIGIVEMNECAFNQQINAIIPNKNINSKYLAYILLYNKNKLNDIANAPIVPIINKSRFENFEINIVENIDKQDSIVEILDKLESILFKYKELLKKIDILIKARFVEMFGDGMKNSKYEKHTISEMCDIVTGTTPDTTNEKCWNGNINWITPAEISDDILFYGETVRKITEYGLKSKSLSIMPAGTVVFSTRAPIGKTCILKYESACNQGFKNCICKKGLLNIYLYCVFKYNSDYFNDLGTGATFKEISKSEFEKVVISVPPIGLQNQFAAFVKQVDKLKFVLFCSIISIIKRV